MSVINQEIIGKIKTKFEEAGLPIPLTFAGENGNLSDEEQIMTHVMLDHMYLVYENIKQARKELKSFLESHDSSLAKELHDGLSEDLNEFPGIWDEWVKDIKPLPSFKEFKAMRKKLKKEMKKAIALSIQELEKQQKKEQPESATTD